MFCYQSCTVPAGIVVVGNFIASFYCHMKYSCYFLNSFLCLHPHKPKCTDCAEQDPYAVFQHCKIDSEAELKSLAALSFFPEVRKSWGRRRWGEDNQISLLYWAMQHVFQGISPFTAVNKGPSTNCRDQFSSDNTMNDKCQKYTNDKNY